MIYYSSMTLADYVAANWVNMDPNLVRIIENEASLLEDARDEADAWNENYRDVLDNAEGFVREVSNLLDEYKGARLDWNTFVDELQSAVDNVELE